MQQDTSTTTSADVTYAYRPSLLGAAWEFRLHADTLEWRLGARSGRIPYHAVRRVRLSFKPATLQGRRFVTEVWSLGEPKLSIISASWRGLMEQAAQDAAYAGFVRALHRRLSAAGSPAIFDAGTPPMLYWPGVVLYAACAAALVLLTGHALITHAWTGAAVMGGLGALLIWQTGGYFLRNYPGRYSPDALPPRLLPG